MANKITKDKKIERLTEALQIIADRGVPRGNRPVLRTGESDYKWIEEYIEQIEDIRKFALTIIDELR